jgi:hypothetical protein
MNAVSANTKTTLLLNNAWMPITAITARAAFCHLLKKRITALDKNGNVFHSLESWNQLADYYEDQPFLRSAMGAWAIPTIIVVTSRFFRKPKKKKFSLSDLAKFCDNTCQYCFVKFPLKDLTIDHIKPKSRGGSDEHENRVLACYNCNRKKGSESPFFDKNGNIPKAPSIPAFMMNTASIREEWLSFLQ